MECFAYNTRRLTNVNTAIIHTTYVNRTVINNVTVNRVSYNGGTGGTSARPTPMEQAAMRERHVAATGEQMRHEQAARGNRALLASVNHGQPAIAATAKAGQFEGHGVMAARTSAPRPETNPRNVPRLQSPGRAIRNQASWAHQQRLAAAPHHQAARADSRPPAETKSREAPGGEHRESGGRREGGERPR